MCVALSQSQSLMQCSQAWLSVRTYLGAITDILSLLTDGIVALY